MKKLYTIEEIKSIKYLAYHKLIEYLRKEVGNTSSNEALEKYAIQAGYFIDEDGKIYKEI